MVRISAGGKTVVLAKAKGGNEDKLLKIKTIGTGQDRKMPKTDPNSTD